MRDVSSVDPAAVGAAILASLRDQIASAAAGASEASADSSAGASAYTVMLNEQTAMVVDPGRYQLVNPLTGATNEYLVLAFSQTLQNAACAGLVGTCVATLPGISSQRRRLQSGSGGGSVNVSLTREYDFAASNASASGTPVADLVRQNGVGVVASQTTALSATTTVTVLGDVATSPLAAAVGGDGLGTALALRMPTLAVDVASVAVTPPAAPPSTPPLPPSVPPQPPSPPPPSSSPRATTPNPNPWIVGLACTAGALAACFLAAVLWHVRNRRLATGRKQQGRASGGRVVSVVPGASARGLQGAASSRSKRRLIGWVPGTSTTVRTTGEGARAQIGAVDASTSPYSSPIPSRRPSRSAWGDQPVHSGSAARVVGAGQQAGARKAPAGPRVSADLAARIDAIVASAAHGTGSDLTVADCAADAAFPLDPALIPSPTRIQPPTPNARPEPSMLDPEAEQRVEALRVEARRRQAELGAAQQRLHSIRASRAPVMATVRLAAAARRPRADQILPPSHRAPSERREGSE